MPAIAKVTFAGPDRRDVIHNVNADGFDSLRPMSALTEASGVCASKVLVVRG